jgi:hypothetical protein
MYKFLTYAVTLTTTSWVLGVGLGEFLLAMFPAVPL